MRLLLLALFALTACTSPRSDLAGAPADTTGRAAVLRLLAEADTSAFRSAFDALADLGYERYEHFSHSNDARQSLGECDTLASGFSYDADVSLSGTQTRLLRVTPTSVRVLRETRNGVFSTPSALTNLVLPADSNDAVDLSAFVLPTDPAYLQRRHVDAYTYRFLPNTLFESAPVRLVEVVVRPDADDPPPVRRVRYWLDAASNRVLAVQLTREDRGLWFRQSSQYYLRVQQRGAAFVPAEGCFVTYTTLPFSAPRRLERFISYAYGRTP